jgi:hypothetical protein
MMMTIIMVIIMMVIAAVVLRKNRYAVARIITRTMFAAGRINEEERMRRLRLISRLEATEG